MSQLQNTADLQICIPIEEILSDKIFESPNNKLRKI